MNSIEEVKIELTNYCKRKCIHCSSDANTENIIELSIEKVKEIIDECSNLKIKTVVLTGGEATEYKDIEELVEYIHQKGIPNIKLYTMCEPTIEKYNLLKRLTGLGLTEIIYSLTISLTTDGQVRYDNIQQFLTDLSNINNLSFHYCLTTKTTKDINLLDNIISKLNQTNFKSLSFLRYVEHGRGKDDLTLTSTDLKEIKPQIIELINKYQHKIHLGSPFNILNIENTPCTAASKTIIIGFDGNVYPCDAMKYFDYLGSGGNIYIDTIEKIYQSEYFKQIRIASQNISDKCKNCKKDKCKGGCLAQKMLEITKKSNSITNITVNWYQENALRTMNNFNNQDLLKLNAYTGIIGEYGEFFDYIKKLYTHNLDKSEKQKILELAPKELGDLVWYLSTSLAVVYNYTLDEVYDYILNTNKYHYQINSNLIEKASLDTDPLCDQIRPKTSYKIDIINEVLNYQNQNIELDEQSVFHILLEFKKKLNKLDYTQTREELIEAVATIFIEVATISKLFFNKNLSEILSDNIEKLRARYPEGFSKEVANLRIDENFQYKKAISTTRVKKLLVTKRVF